MVDDAVQGGKIGGRGWMIALAVALLGVIPYVLHPEQDFRNDDVVMVVHGARGSLGEATANAFTRPWLDTWILQFYRPLYALHYAVESRIFGADPVPYYRENILWQFLAVLCGTGLLARIAGGRAAFLGGLFFALSPWVVNNVAWLVGRCTTVATVFAFLTALLYLRHVDRGRRGVPLLAMTASALGIFYRETALFGVVLVFLFDLLEGRRDRRALRDWILIGAPFLVYLAARFAVLGTLTGGYARLMGLVRWTDPEGGVLGRWETLGQLVLPGTGVHPNPAWELLGGIEVLVVLAFFLGLGFPRARRQLGVLAFFVVFIVLHALPLLVVDGTIQGGASQRWHTVIWAVGGMLGALAASIRIPFLGAGAMLALSLFGGFLGWRWLDHHEESARLIGELRREIAASPAGTTTVVHNVRPYDGTTVFFEAGLGLFGEPPFSGTRQSVQPVAFEARFVTSDPQAQTPLAIARRARGEAVRALWIDWDTRKVITLGDPVLDLARQRLAAIPRIDLRRTPAENDALVLSWSSPEGAERFVLHLLTPLAETPISLALEDDRLARTAAGELSFDDGRLRELAIFTAPEGPAPVSFWLAAYRTGDENPIAISDVLDVELIASRESRRPVR